MIILNILSSLLTYKTLNNMFAPMRTIIYGQQRNISPFEGLSKERRALVTEANRLLSLHKKQKRKLRKEIAQNRKRVSS